MAQQLTPHSRELDARCEAMDRLKRLAQTGISFCLGLDLEPYGENGAGEAHSLHLILKCWACFHST